MALIQLNHGLSAIVDDADYDWLSSMRWVAYRPPSAKSHYARARLNGARTWTLMHRLILGLTDSNVIVDHVSRDGLDNRRENIRIATRSENARNRVLLLPNKTGYRGVCYIKRDNRYRANIRHDGKSLYLGYFETAELAHAAYVTAGRELFGELFDDGSSIQVPR